MIWSIIQQIGFFIFLFLTIYYVRKNNFANLLVLYFAGLAFAACCVYYITIWTPEKVACMGMAYCIIFKRKHYNTRMPKPLKNILWSLIFLLFISTVIGIASTPKYTYLISPIQRLILSNFSYISNSIILIYGILLPIDLKGKFFPKYCRVMELAILTGLLHLIFLSIGVEFMPIHRAGLESDTMGNEVVAEFGGSIISRIYAFAGEPKGLAFCILPYIIISICMFLRNSFIKSKKYHLVFLALGLFILFQTYSSAAFINVIVLIPLILFLGGIKPSPTLLGIIFIGVVFALIVGMTSDRGFSTFADSINQRTFERGQTELANDRQETVIMNSFIEENGIVKIFGWGLGQYTFNVPGQVWGNSILIPVQSGIVLTLADFGFLGLILYLYVFFVILRLIRKSKAIGSPIILAFSMAALSKFFESTMHGNVTTPLMYLMVAYYMYIYEKRNIINEKNGCNNILV